MGFFQSLDEAILGRFQKVSDWVNDWYGRSCFFLARICVWVALICITIVAYQLTSIPTAFALIAILGLTLFRLLNLFERIDKEKHEQMEVAGTANPLHYRLSPSRIRLALWSCVITAGVAGLYAIGDAYATVGLAAIGVCWALTTSSYFISCTPRPRNPRKAPVSAVAQGSMAR